MSIAYLAYFSAGRLLHGLLAGWTGRSRNRYHFDRRQRRWISLAG